MKSTNLIVSVMTLTTSTLTMALPSMPPPPGVIGNAAQCTGTLMSQTTDTFPAHPGDKGYVPELAGQYVFACCLSEFWDLANSVSDKGELQCDLYGQKRLPDMPAACLGASKPCAGHPRGCCVKDTSLDPPAGKRDVAEVAEDQEPSPTSSADESNASLLASIFDNETPPKKAEQRNEDVERSAQRLADTPDAKIVAREVVPRGSHEGETKNAGVACPDKYFSKVQKAFNETTDLNGKEVYACCEQEWFLSSQVSEDDALQCRSYVDNTQFEAPAKPKHCTGTAKACKGHPMGCCTDLPDQKFSNRNLLARQTQFPHDGAKCPWGKISVWNDDFSSASDLANERVSVCCLGMGGWLLDNHLNAKNGLQCLSDKGKGEISVKAPASPIGCAGKAKKCKHHPKGCCIDTGTTHSSGNTKRLTHELSARDDEGISCPKNYHSSREAAFMETDYLDGKQVYACCEKDWYLHDSLSMNNELQCESYAKPGDVERPPVPNGCTGATKQCEGHSRGCCMDKSLPTGAKRLTRRMLVGEDGIVCPDFHQETGPMRSFHGTD